MLLLCARLLIRLLFACCCNNKHISLLFPSHNIIKLKEHAVIVSSMPGIVVANFWLSVCVDVGDW